VTRNPRGERALPCSADENFIAAFACEYGCNRVAAYSVVSEENRCLAAGVVYKVMYADSLCKAAPKLLVEGCLVVGRGSAAERLRGLSTDEVLEAIVEPGFVAALVDCSIAAEFAERIRDCRYVTCFESLGEFVEGFTCRPLG